MDTGLPPLKEGYRWNFAKTDYYTIGEYPEKDTHVVLTIERSLPNPKPKRWFRRNWTPMIWVQEGQSYKHERYTLTPAILNKMVKEAFESQARVLDAVQNAKYADSIEGTYPPKDVKDTQ